MGPMNRPRKGFLERPAKFWVMTVLLLNAVNAGLCAWGAVNTSVYFYAYFLVVGAATVWTMTETARW